MARWNYAFFDSGARWNSPDAAPTTMRNLASFLKNPFDDDGISLAELVAFTTDHLQRMGANNAGGELTGRITATTSALALVQECAADDLGHMGLRKAGKQTKDEFRRDLPAEVERVEAGFIAAFGAGSPILLEALPQGRTVFQTCRDDQLEMHLHTLHQAATTHQSGLAPATVTLAASLKNSWAAVYQASEGSTGGKTQTQEGKKLARENLQLMLFLNLIKLMEMFPRQPEKLSLYMQQHLLENPGSNGREEPESPPAPPTA